MTIIIITPIEKKALAIELLDKQIRTDKEINANRQDIMLWKTTKRELSNSSTYLSLLKEKQLKTIEKLCEYKDLEI